jgi:hypothetical protein
MDEAAFFYSDDFYQNTDVEVLNSVRPALATTGGPVITQAAHTRDAACCGTFTNIITAAKAMQRSWSLKPHPAS